MSRKTYANTISFNIIKMELTKDFLEALKGAKRVMIETEEKANDTTRVFVDNYTETAVELTREFGAHHAKFDCPTYLENKLNKAFPKDVDIRLGLCVDPKTNSKQSLSVTITINQKFTSFSDVQTLMAMCYGIMEIAEERLTEPARIAAMAADCKPWIIEDETSSESAS